MAASYPSSIKSFSAKANGDVIAVTHVTDLEAEVAAIETALVTGPITLNSVAVTGVTTVAAGNAAAPSVVSTTGTSDTGVFFPAADTVAASTAGSERLRIDSSGNVGIGTSSPSTKFTVSSGINAGIAVTDGTVNTIIYNSTGGVSTIGTTSNHPVQLYVNNSSRFLISTSGNVGIGTASPAQKLDVNGILAVGAESGDNEIIFRNQTSSLSTGFSVGIRGDIGGNNNDFKIVRFNSSGVYQDIPFQIQQTTGNVGIGLSAPAYLLHVNTDSAGKPGAGGLWTVVSDERIKTDIVDADLDRCYEIVKAVPLKHFGFKPGVYTDEQIQDKHSLGWIAQDVQQVFEKAVSVKPFTLHTDIPDGTEDYEEQAFTLDQVETTTTSIQIIDGKPVQVSKTETTENKVLLFDTVDVLDESGEVVMNGDTPLTYQMPRMVTKTRLKVRHETIEDCLDLNSGQMIAALYGCVQALMAKVEALEARG